MIETSPILVIGSNSFSGASFCKTLIDQGSRVIGISRSNEPNSVILPYKWSTKSSNLQFYQLDLNHHLDKIISLVKQEKIRYVYNFAAQSMVAQSWDNPEHWFTTNVTSTIKLHNQLRQIDSLERYIHISTPEVYGSCSGLVKESKIYAPSTPYAVSRAAADLSLHSFFQAYQFPVVFTRAANVFGEGQQLYRIIPRSILYGLLGKKLKLHGGGFSTRSFIHIDDVSDATLKIAERGINGEIYHISTERMITIRSLVKLISDMLNISFDDLVEDSEDRLGKDAAYLLDSSKLRSELAWRDTVSLENGIDKTITWAKDNLECLKTLPHNYIHKE